MIVRKRFLVATALAFLSLFAIPAAKADPQCFTLDSLEGNYAIIGTYGANVALALGTRHNDGNGNFTGTFVVNEPTPGSTTGARTIVTGTIQGTYTVSCDGTGVSKHTVTTSSGTSAPVMDNFVITKARIEHSRSGDRLIATAIVDAQQAASQIVPGGIFLTRSYTRLPDTHQESDQQN